jgi:hypothetical protein
VYQVGIAYYEKNASKNNEAICKIQEEFTANGIKKKLDGLKNKYLSDKITVSE